jgi:hypothetical protein
MYFDFERSPTEYQRADPSTGLTDIKTPDMLEVCDGSVQEKYKYKYKYKTCATGQTRNKLLAGQD